MSSKKKIIIIVTLFICVFTFVYMNINITYAKYISNVNNSIDSGIAKFSFVIKDGDKTVSSNFNYNLASNITDGNNLSKSGLVPGKSGSVDIIIDMSGSEVASAYSISFIKFDSIPDNFKFYSDAAMTDELDLTNDSYDGIINLADINTPVHEYIYYKWLWDESVVENNYEGKNFDIDIKVTARQYVGV